MSVLSELSGCPSLFAFSSRAAFAPSTLDPRRKKSPRTLTPSRTFPPQNNGNVLTTLAWLLGWDTPLGLLSLDTTLWYNATWLGYSDWFTVLDKSLSLLCCPKSELLADYLPSSLPSIHPTEVKLLACCLSFIHLYHFTSLAYHSSLAINSLTLTQSSCLTRYPMSM